MTRRSRRPAHAAPLAGRQVPAAGGAAQAGPAPPPLPVLTGHVSSFSPVLTGHVKQALHQAEAYKAHAEQLASQEGALREQLNLYSTKFKDLQVATPPPPHPR